MKQILIPLLLGLLITPYGFAENTSTGLAQSTSKDAEMPPPAPTHLKRIQRQPATEPAQNAGASTHIIQPTSSLSFFERAIRFARHGQYNEAVEYFSRAQDSDPNNIEIFNRRARAEWQLEDNDHALKDANWAIKLNPDYAEAFCTRAAIYNSMGRYQDAIADASMAHDLKPNLGDAYVLEAAAYRNLNQHKEADEIISHLNSLPETVSAFDEWHPNIDYTPYFAYLQATVKQKWHPPSGSYAAAVPVFKIHRDGRIKDLRLNNTTGDPDADNAALEAVRSSAPFRQPPAGSPPDFNVYIVLDAPVRTPDRQVNAAQQQPQRQPQTAPSGAGAFNWSGTLNQGVNQGLNIMQRFLPR